MAASVLNTPRAVEVSIAIVRTFIKLREMIIEYKDLTDRLDEMEQKYDGQFRIVFDAIRALISEPAPKEKKIGYIKEQKAVYRASAGMSA